MGRFPNRTQDVCVVIMAGGRGTRFWPRSRASSPKQFLDIVGTDTMIRLTCDRIGVLVPPEAVYVVTNADYREKVATQLPELPAKNILTEPAVRSTAPCIGLAALHIRRDHPDAVMVVLPADHHIPDRAVFLQSLSTAIETARRTHALVTIGIEPSYPETGYGYIEVGETTGEGIHRVSGFREKPDRDTAARFVASGRHLWNTGMFIWPASIILENMARHAPEIYRGLEAFAPHIGQPDEWTQLERIYSVFPSRSIDHAVMEHARDVYVIRGRFGWSDVGSWSAVEPFWDKDENGNALRGKAISIDSRQTISASDGRLIALVGVENLIVIDTPDAVLICRKDRDQDIKKIIEALEQRGMTEYL
ncbi:MAG: mannose-1-phosphate guanylyltransferase [candidate division Zixibacteria bacterium]|nr:mannose-1-phosphate guanylyltransferase [candidate division Zixibacteria bacterium]